MVAAAIVDSLEAPSRLLTTARSYPPQLRGQFEFPGGKVEPGEDWLPALRRELAEELGVQINVGSQLLNEGAPWPIMPGRVMRVWLATLASPLPDGPFSSHGEVTWRPVSQVAELPWLASNRPIVSEFLRWVKATGGGNAPGCGSVGSK